MIQLQSVLDHPVICHFIHYSINNNNSNHNNNNQCEFDDKFVFFCSCCQRKVIKKKQKARIESSREDDEVTLTFYPLTLVVMLFPCYPLILLVFVSKDDWVDWGWCHLVALHAVYLLVYHCSLMYCSPLLSLWYLLFSVLFFYCCCLCRLGMKVGVGFLHLERAILREYNG